MAIVGHWLHFGYSDVMEMEIELFMKFIDECAILAKNSE
jgi:hypothetical protein